MKCSFRINVANDVNTDYANTAINACREFINLFPEYKDNFDISISYKGKFVNITTGKTIDFDGTISKEKFNEIYPNGNDKYIALPNGRYLVPGESMAWYETFAKHDNFEDSLDYDKIAPEQLTWSNRHLSKENPTKTFHLAVTNKKLRNHSGLFGFGISSQEIGSFVSTSGFSKEKFKRLILHEFGHVFMAEHDDRTNTTKTQYGTHCATDGCILRDVSFAPLEAANQPKLFCEQCIESMHSYIGKILKNERTPSNQTQVVDSAQELPPNAELNDEFKNPWREFAQNIAKKMDWEYEEDEKRTNYSAILKAKDGTKTFVNASSENNVSLSAKDKDGKSKIPDAAVFKELVAKAKKDNQTIAFGNIKSAEFKARLLVAAMASNPPVKTVGAPELNDEFLNSINPQTAQLLKTLQNKQQFRNNNNDEENKTENKQDEEKEGTSEKKENTNKTEKSEKTPYEESRDARKRVLEAKLKSNTITPMEQAELNYIHFSNKRKKALEAAKKRTGSNTEPRSVEHIKETGLPKEDYKFYDTKNREFRGWKLHLDVVPNRNHPTTKAVSEFLEKLEVSHKIASGGDNGKGMTIYVGGYYDASKLSKEIRSRFGKDVAEPPLYTDQKGEELDFNPIVTGRFYLQDIFETQYPRSSIKGICPADYGSLCDKHMESLVTGLAKKEGLVNDSYIMQNKDNTNFHDHYVVTNLESYCAHKFYQKHLGEFYCEKDADKFEEKVFGAKLPEKGSEERKKWDDIAVRYANVLESNNPECIKKMQSVKQEYTPIDFRKAPPRFNPHQKTGGINS